MSTKKTHFNLALMKLRDICTVVEEIPSGWKRKLPRWDIFEVIRSGTFDGPKGG
jgi:hypothetical protein